MPSTIVILVLLWAWSGPRGAEAGSPPSLARLAEQYRGAGRDDAVARVGLWTRRELEGETQALLEAMEAATLAGDATPEDLSRREQTLLAGAALLSDAAWRGLYRGDPGWPRWGLRSAARLSASASPGGEFARRFSLVAGLTLHTMLDLAAAHELFSAGLRHGEQDAELLLGLGAVTETIVALRDYEQPGGARGRRDSRDGIRFEIEGEAGEGGRLPPVSLADAQALYAKALQRSPGLLEARVRLGRVLLLRGRDGEALAELRQVSGDAARPSQRYMARLFEGRARERLGDSRGAAEAFSAAAAEVPKAQSALVALGRALDRLGERTRSQEAFDRAVLHEMYAQGDPWLAYIRGQPARIGDLVEELRGLVP